MKVVTINKVRQALWDLYMDTVEPQSVKEIAVASGCSATTVNTVLKEIHGSGDITLTSKNVPVHGQAFGEYRGTINCRAWMPSRKKLVDSIKNLVGVIDKKNKWFGVRFPWIEFVRGSPLDTTPDKE